MTNIAEIQDLLLIEKKNDNAKKTFSSAPNQIINNKNINGENNNDLFNIKWNENMTIPKSDVNIVNNDIHKKQNEYNNNIHKIESDNNLINNNNDDISLSNISYNRRLEFANQLFDNISNPNSIEPSNSNLKALKDNNNIFSNIESSKNIEEIIKDKEQSLKPENIIKEEEDNIINIDVIKDNFKDNINNNINNNMNYNNINNINMSINLNKDNLCIIDNINNNNLINGINKKNNENENMQNIHNDDLNNKKVDKNESISIGEIDLDALPKFNDMINFKNESVKIEKIDNDDIKTKNENKENDEINNNLNINEHINNLNLANKIKYKHQNKKKKSIKSSKNKEIVNNYENSNDNSNIPLEKNNKNIFEILPSSSSTKNNINNIFNKKEKIKVKRKITAENKNEIIPYIKKRANRDKNKEENNLQKDSKNNINFFNINSSNSIGTPFIEKNISSKTKRKSHKIIMNNNYNINELDNIRDTNVNTDNGNPIFSGAYNEEINNEDIIINNNTIYTKDIDINNIFRIHKNIKNEISFSEFIEKKRIYIPKNEILENNKRKNIINNLYFSEYIINEETIFDKINKYNIEEPLHILYQYVDNSKIYSNNFHDYLILFQYINDKDKNNLYHKYKEISNNKKYTINPYLNDYNDFKNSFEMTEKKKSNNFEYIRYINEINGDSFYRGFIFNYIEYNLINHKIKEIIMLIIDIFKIYDLNESIFSNDNINMKNVLICFSIINDFIKINAWDTAYKFFISVYNDVLDEALVKYLRYNIVLYLSKIDFIINSDNRNKYKKKRHNHIDDYDIKNEYKFEYISHLAKYNEPTRIIFQSITYIFGISLNIFYYSKEKYNRNNNSNLNISSFKNPYHENLCENKEINLFFCYDNYHICYKKAYINSNGNDSLLNLFIKNLNTLSPISKNYNIISKSIHCSICNVNSNFLEIKSFNIKENIYICQQCLNLQIDEHIKQRVIFLQKEKFKNYLYYLKPIIIEIYSEKDKINIININITNYDYIHLSNKTFNERINELMIDICLLCSKREPLNELECGCEFCFNCIKLYFLEVTKGRIILNNYEKIKLEKKLFKCPLCSKNLNINNFVKIFEKNKANLEHDYNEAKQRLKKVCVKKCLFCLKKINKIEVDSNIKKHIKFKVTLFLDEDDAINNNILEKGLDYCDDEHSLCSNCFKVLNKNKKELKKDKDVYKIVYCNICNIEHYIDMKEWNKFKSSNKCCKCNIF